MSDDKHSPGPWKWENWMAANGTMRLMGGDGDSVMRLNMRDEQTTKEPWPADARLIEAAPELLAMVERLCDYDAADEDAYDAARALVARIRGAETISGKPQP